MDLEEQRLESLKAKMTPQQRQDMAEMLQNELNRRAGEKKNMNKGNKNKANKRYISPTAVNSSKISGGLNRDELADVYSGIDSNVHQMRLNKLENKLQEAKRQQANLSREPKASVKLPALQLPQLPNPFSSKNAVLMYGVISFGVLRVVMSGGLVEQAEVEINNNEQNTKIEQIAETPAADDISNQRARLASAPISSSFLESGANKTWDEADKHLLSGLDDRRVELEKRRSALDDRENELDQQSRIIAERIAELRTLTAKLSESRKEKDHRYEARLEQLARVYSSMAPNEAAGLIAKIDEDIALSLLQRMPGKRMGQILGLMSPDRAVALTKSLTNKQQL